MTPATASRELGAWGAEQRLEVDAARLAAYAAAIDDPAPAHRDGAAAGPLLALAAAIPALLEAGFAALPADAGPTVHAEHRIRTERAVRPGDVLVTRARAIGMTPRRSGGLLAVEAETRDAAGELIAQQTMGIHVRGVRGGATGGAESGVGGSGGAEPGGAEPVAVVPRAPDARILEIATSADQAARYAAATGDRMPVHLDAAAARAAGFPGVILHGACTWAMVLARLGAPARGIAAVRFTGPLAPGETLVVRAAGRADGPEGLRLEASTADGRPVLGVGQLIEAGAPSRRDPARETADRPSHERSVP